MMRIQQGEFMGRYQLRISRMPLRTFWLVMAFLFYEGLKRYYWKKSYHVS